MKKKKKKEMKVHAAECSMFRVLHAAACNNSMKHAACCMEQCNKAAKKIII